jgi:hypothetical protein
MDTEPLIRIRIRSGTRTNGGREGETIVNSGAVCQIRCHLQLLWLPGERITSPVRKQTLLSTKSKPDLPLDFGFLQDPLTWYSSNRAVSRLPL